MLFPATYSQLRMADWHLQHGGLSCSWWLPQTYQRCHCLLEGMVRKDRLRYIILPGILESKSWAWLSPRLPLCESGHQTLHVSNIILEVFSARDICTVPGTAKHRMPWRNSHDTQCSHGLLWEQVPGHLQPPMQMLVSFFSHKPLGCMWTDRPGMHQTEGRVTWMCSQSSPSVHSCPTGEPTIQSMGRPVFSAPRRMGGLVPHSWKGIAIFWCCLSIGTWLSCSRC